MCLTPFTNDNFWRSVAYQFIFEAKLPYALGRATIKRNDVIYPEGRGESVKRGRFVIRGGGNVLSGRHKYQSKHAK